MSSEAPLKIIFAGTPDFSVPALQALINSPHQVVGVYTQPDRPAGRGRKLSPSPIKTCALQNGIPVYQPEKLKTAEEQEPLIALKADLMVVVAYGIILPKVILDAPRLGCINIHASLLPRWRGAAPIQRAILAGDKETGITIMQMDVGLDTGDMLLKKVCPIKPEDTGSSLHDRLAQMGAEALLEALPGILRGDIKAEKQQDELTCYAAKLQKTEALINWENSAVEIQAQVNAFNAWPVAQTPLDINQDAKPQMMRIWRAEVLHNQPEHDHLEHNEPGHNQPGKVISCTKQGIDVQTGDGLLRLLQIQLPGKKPIDVQSFVNANDITGLLLG